MILTAIILVFCGALIGSGITLAVGSLKAERIEREAWKAARLFYSHVSREK